MLDQLETDDAVVCGPGIGQEGCAVGRGFRVDRVDELGVKDGVDTVDNQLVWCLAGHPNACVSVLTMGNRHSA